MKHSKSLNLQQLPKKRYSTKQLTYFPIVLFSSWIGTYLDLYFVGKKLYQFPVRPFPTIFSINILFTLIVLPLSTWIFIQFCRRLTRLSRWLFIILVSLIAPIGEIVAERIGLFAHDEKWHHFYSFIGYALFFIVIWWLFVWVNRRSSR